MSSVSSVEKGELMAVGKGLGRGLDVLLKGLAVDKETMEVTMVKVADVRPNPRQPRLDFSEESLVELAASIKEQGVLQPIMVRPASPGPEHGYELVAGERRLRACKLAGLDTVPAVVREIDDQQSLALALIENLQRENLNALEEAKGLDQLQHTFGLSQEALAQKMGRSRSAVANSLRLLQLDEQMQESLRENTISAGHARALLAISDESVRVDLWKRMLDSGISVREAERLVNVWREVGSLPVDEHSIPAKKKQIFLQETAGT